MNAILARRCLVGILVSAGIWSAAVWATETPSIICLGHTNGLWISSDGGESFAAAPDLEGAFVQDVAVSGGVIYAGTLSGLSVSSDLGVSFESKGAECGIPSGGVSAILPDDGLLYIGTGSSHVAVSEDEGVTFHGLGRVAAWVACLLVYQDALYVGTGGGLCISTDGGESFVTRTVDDGLAANIVYCVAVDETTIYAGTTDGLSVSTDGGETFVARTVDDGLPHSRVNAVCLDGGTLYVGTLLGFAISHDGGTTFEARGMQDGLPGNSIDAVLVHGDVVYVLTNGGLCVSNDGCETFVVLAAEGHTPGSPGAMAIE